MTSQDTIFRNATDIAECQTRIGRTLQAEETKRIFKSLFTGLFRLVEFRALARKVLR